MGRLKACGSWGWSSRSRASLPQAYSLRAGEERFPGAVAPGFAPLPLRGEGRCRVSAGLRPGRLPADALVFPTGGQGCRGPHGAWPAGSFVRMPRPRSARRAACARSGALPARNDRGWVLFHWDPFQVAFRVCKSQGWGTSPAASFIEKRCCNYPTMPLTIGQVAVDSLAVRYET